MGLEFWVFGDKSFLEGFFFDGNIGFFFSEDLSFVFFEVLNCFVKILYLGRLSFFCLRILKDSIVGNFVFFFVYR